MNENKISLFEEYDEGKRTPNSKHIYQTAVAIFMQKGNKFLLKRKGAVILIKVGIQNVPQNFACLYKAGGNQEVIISCNLQPTKESADAKADV